MQDWLGLLAIVVSVIAACISWWRSIVAHKAAIEANRIQAEIGERDRLRFEYEESFRQASAATLLAQSQTLWLVSAGLADLSEVRAQFEEVWLENKHGRFAEYSSYFDITRVPTISLGSLSRDHRREPKVLLDRLRVGVAALAKNYIESSGAEALNPGGLTMGAVITIRYSHATMNLDKTVRFRVQGQLMLVSQNSQQSIHAHPVIAIPGFKVGDLLINSSALQSGKDATEVG